MKADVIGAVYGVILDRKENPRDDSYVCRLFAKGEDKILQKIGEESVEVILASKSGDEEALIKELADLAFHSLVLLGHKNIPPQRVADELSRRFGTSGIEEKNSRKKQD